MTFCFLLMGKKIELSKKSEALSDAMRRKKLLPYAGINRKVQRSGLTFFNLFSSLANILMFYSVIDSYILISWCIITSTHMIVNVQAPCFYSVTFVHRISVKIVSIAFCGSSNKGLCAELSKE